MEAVRAKTPLYSATSGGKNVLNITTFQEILCSLSSLMLTRLLYSRLFPMLKTMSLVPFLQKNEYDIMQGSNFLFK